MQELAIGAPVVVCGAMVIWATLMEVGKSPRGRVGTWVAQTLLFMCGLVTVVVGAVITIGDLTLN